MFCYTLAIQTYFVIKVIGNEKALPATQCLSVKAESPERTAYPSPTHSVGFMDKACILVLKGRHNNYIVPSGLKWRYYLLNPTLCVGLGYIVLSGLSCRKNPMSCH